MSKIFQIPRYKGFKVGIFLIYKPYCDIYLSSFMRKLALPICQKTKAQISVTMQLIRAFVFAL